MERYHITVGIPVYWLAWANIGVIGEKLVIDPYVFEADARDRLGYLIPAKTFNIEAIEIGQARFSEDFVIKNTLFSTTDFTAYGRDDYQGLPGRAEIEVPQEIAADYLVTLGMVEIGEKRCPRPFHIGELENGTVVSHFDILNRGEAPLWICSVEFTEDSDNVFDVRLPSSLPVSVPAGEAVTVDVLMTPEPDDHLTHNGSIEVRSNDFEQPRVIIPVHGIMMSEEDFPLGSRVCVTLPSKFSYDTIVAIYELVYGHIQVDMPEIISPPLPEPKPGPPYPECGYYLDLAIAGNWPQLQSEVSDPALGIIERSRSIDDVHFLSIPLSPPDHLQFSIEPTGVKGPGTMSLGFSRLSMVGLWESARTVSQITAEIEFVYVISEAGIDIVNIDDPSNPVRVSNISVKQCRDVKIRNGYLYALTDQGVGIFNINDPYNPSLEHTIETVQNSGFEFVGKKLVVFEPNKLRVYQICEGATPVWLNEFKSREEIRTAYKIGNSLLLDVKDKAYVFSAFDFREFADAKPFAMKEIRMMFPNIELIMREIEQPMKYVSHDEYLLTVLKDGKGFAILRKKPVPYKFRSATIEEYLSREK